jgi:hypothetical protein
MGDTQTHGIMTVEISNGASIVGPGDLKSDSSGQVWFDYTGKNYPSRIDWKKAKNLKFKPHIGKEKSYHASETDYFFDGAWVGPRLGLQKPHRPMKSHARFGA